MQDLYRMRSSTRKVMNKVKQNDQVFVILWHHIRKYMKLLKSKDRNDVVVELLKYVTKQKQED